MAVTAEQKAYVCELFEGVGTITSRAMMGGMTFYADGDVFAILGSDEQVYLKAKGALADELAAEGCSIFSMTRKDGSQGSMGYWTLPDAALDDPEEACIWARKALTSPDRQSDDEKIGNDFWLGRRVESKGQGAEPERGFRSGAQTLNLPRAKLKVNAT